MELMQGIGHQPLAPQPKALPKVKANPAGGLRLVERFVIKASH